MSGNTVLIDLESVQPATLEALAAGDYRVLIFVGKSQPRLKFELVESAQRLGNRVEYVKLSGSGPNALDFHIAFYVGRLASSDPTMHFHIISKDTGFDPLINHLKSLNLKVSRWSSITEIPALRTKKGKAPHGVAGRFVEMLRQPKSTRPRTPRTLERALQAFGQNQLSEAEVKSAIQSMRDRGIIAVDQDRVTYPGL
mgnify:CR=1 FL=1